LTVSVTIATSVSGARRLRLLGGRVKFVLMIWSPDWRPGVLICFVDLTLGLPSPGFHFAAHGFPFALIGAFNFRLGLGGLLLGGEFAALGELRRGTLDASVEGMLAISLLETRQQPIAAIVDHAVWGRNDRAGQPTVDGPKGDVVAFGDSARSDQT
jgi:hypothetical protein